MIIPKQAVEFIKKYEGFRANAYQCPAGIWTIGYGTTFYPDGKKVEEGDVINIEDATFCLYDFIKKYCLQQVEDIEKVIGKLNDNQKTAIISLVYNIGSCAFEKSKCKKFILKNDIENACKNWDWIKANGKILNNLIKRRNEEIELFYGIRNYWKK